jgi:hypothetical protein
LNQTLNSTAIIFVGLSALIAFGNGLIFYRRKIGKYVSMIPLLSQIFAGMAIFLLVQTQQPWIPVWSPLLIGFSDPALWEILHVLIRRKRG